VTIRSPGGTQHGRVALASGRATFRWVPSKRGQADVRAEAEGVDGSRVAARTVVRVLSRPPTVRLVRPPRHAVVGRPVRVRFRVAHGAGAVVDVASRAGVEFTRRYLAQHRGGVVEWTPRAAGRTVLRVRAIGHDGQSSADAARITVTRAPRVLASPTVTLVRTPHVARVGRASEIAFAAGGCREAVARIDEGEQQQTWRFRCAGQPMRFAWSPKRAGDARLTVTARGRHGASSQTAVPLRVEGPA
jgi:hypothetical protein